MRRLSVLVLPLVIACAPAAQTNAGTATAGSATQNTAAEPAAGLMGNYTVTLDETDLPTTTSQQQRSASVGTWAFAFRQGNHFAWRRNGSEMVRGSYEIKGNQITFPGDETGRAACTTTGVYTWQISDGQLTFTRVNDACQGRVVVLTSRPLTRRP